MPDVVPVQKAEAKSSLQCVPFASEEDGLLPPVHHATQSGAVIDGFHMNSALNRRIREARVAERDISEQIQILSQPKITLATNHPEDLESASIDREPVCAGHIIRSGPYFAVALEILWTEENDSGKPSNVALDKDQVAPLQSVSPEIYKRRRQCVPLLSPTHTGRSHGSPKAVYRPGSSNGTFGRRVSLR
jgi:hypothetical protein